MKKAVQDYIDNNPKFPIKYRDIFTEYMHGNGVSKYTTLDKFIDLIYPKFKKYEVSKITLNSYFEEFIHLIASKLH